MDEKLRAFPKGKWEICDVKLEVEGLSSGKEFQDVSFDVKEEKYLALPDLVGSGRTALIETIFGIRKKTAGHVLIDGEEIKIKFRLMQLQMVWRL